MTNKLEIIKDLLMKSQLGQAASNIGYELKNYIKALNKLSGRNIPHNLMTELDDYFLRKEFPDWFVKNARNEFFPEHLADMRDPIGQLFESVGKNALMGVGGLAGGAGLGAYLADVQNEKDAEGAVSAMFGEGRTVPLFILKDGEYVPLMKRPRGRPRKDGSQPPMVQAYTKI